MDKIILLLLRHMRTRLRTLLRGHKHRAESVYMYKLLCHILKVSGEYRPSFSKIELYLAQLSACLISLSCPAFLTHSLKEVVQPTIAAVALVAIAP